MDARTVAITILLVALAGFAVAYVVVGPGRRRRLKRRADVPLAMRPYYSDEELETTAIERAMAWGVALTLFMAVFLPVYWLIEPQRISDKVDQFYEEDVIRGRFLFAEACAACHGPDAGGGSAPNPNPDIKAPWPAPALNNIVARYRDNPNVTDIRQFMTQTIKQGRPGTPMPAWGAFYGGPFNDQQVDNIVTYLLSIQIDEVPEPQAFPDLTGEELFQANCARCHGETAAGGVGPSLLDVFRRSGADGTPEKDQEAIEAVRDTILNGRIVPGGTPMPAWRDILTLDAINRIIGYLMSIQAAS